MMKFETPSVHLANAKSAPGPHLELLDQENSRLFIEAISSCLFSLSRQPDTEAAKQFVKTVSQTGAEFVVNIVNNGHRVPRPVELGRKVYELQHADHHMFPDMPFVENVITGVRPYEFIQLLGAHAGNVAHFSDSLPEHQRANREDAALAVVAIMSSFVEENRLGLLLNTQAKEQLTRIAVVYDATFPNE